MSGCCGRALPRRALCILGVLCGLAVIPPAQAVTLVIATVDNGQLLQLQALSSAFEQAHPDIRLRWITLTENQLRQHVSSDLATHAGLVDVLTIGLYEVPIWARRGWLRPIRPAPGYDPGDLLDNIRAGLSHRGQLYAAPIYGESSMLMYRKDLMRQAGLTMPANPTWTEIAAIAAGLNDPANEVHGICLRGTPGWGENMALVTTMVNAFGGQWFDLEWRPQLQSKPWRDAVGLYVELLTRYGPKDAAARGFNENLALFQAGRCALWVDATVAGGFVANPEQSRWADSIGFAQAPAEVTAKGSHWLWAWSLAIPASDDATREAAAQKFVNWATSRDYLELVASEYGWGLVPSGTRRSTYANPQFQRAAPWAAMELEAIRTADPTDATLPKSPYVGVQFAVIPEFRTIGDAVGEFIAAALDGKLSVEEALARSQHVTSRQLVLGGYPKALERPQDCQPQRASGNCR